jgi:hypothetical protein
LAFPSLTFEMFVLQCAGPKTICNSLITMFATKIFVDEHVENLKELTISSEVPGKIVSIAPPKASL